MKDVSPLDWAALATSIIALLIALSTYRFTRRNARRMRQLDRQRWGDISRTQLAHLKIERVGRQINETQHRINQLRRRS